MKCIRNFMAMLLVPGLAILNSPVTTLAQAETAVIPSTAIVHTPLKSVPSGKRIPMSVQVKDPQGIDLVRIYFKGVDGEDYSFISLDPSPEAIRTGIITSGEFSGNLPAPAKDAGWVDYLFLVKNSDQVVVTSQNFTVSVAPATDGADLAAEPLKVFSELDQLPEKIVGFADNLAYQSIEPAGRYGIVAGLSPAAGPAPADAISGGTVVASTGPGGVNNMLLGGLALAALVGGGLAMAGGGGGSSSTEPEPEPEPEPVPELCPYSGNWIGSYSEVDCESGISVQGSWGGTVNSECFLTSSDSTRGKTYFQGQINRNTGNANLGGITDACGNILTAVSTFSGSLMNGTYQGGTIGSLAGSRR
jgi:hypothetical protein